jgi:2-polyprenyl-6-hydroxyphenyl methylase/3-demethylubiquinone-9 3-methyltransferase
MNRYYSDKLSAKELQRVYEIATPRIRQYLKAEIDFVLDNVSSTDSVLETGCGYGRVIKELCTKARLVAGIDTSLGSLRLATDELYNDNYTLYCMNAVSTGFADNTFDLVTCIQNGISAFKVDKLKIIRETIRITRPGGTVLFSSYSEKFWDDRLEWFQLQSDEGLLGEIDYSKTGDGVIVCKDGFKATTVTPDDFRKLTLQLGLTSQIIEVDNSSLFCKIRV